MMPRLLPIVLLVVLLRPVLVVADDRLETLQDHLLRSEHVVEVCVYQQRWTKPAGDMRKGTFTYSAVITRVHKGTIPVGTKIEYHRYFEDAPRYIPDFSSTVEGELKVFMVSDNEGQWDGNKFVIDGDGGFVFPFGDEFHRLFLTLPVSK